MVEWTGNFQEVKPIRELPPELNNDKKNKIHISHKRNINGNGR